MSYLRGPGGNPSLADFLERERPNYLGPVRHTLLPLRRIAGPEPNIDWPKDPADWESDISGKVKAIKEGWAPLPLIVQLRDMAIFDGNRRHVTPGAQYCARIGKRKVRHSPRR